MTIPCNKNITKQLNSYFYVIAITLQGLLQRSKRALKILSDTITIFFLLKSDTITIWLTKKKKHFVVTFYFC